MWNSARPSTPLLAPIRAAVSLTPAAADSGVSASVLNEQQGVILLQVCELRALRLLLPKHCETAAMFDADLDDLEDLRLTNVQRMLVLQRMPITHGFLCPA